MATDGGFWVAARAHVTSEVTGPPALIRQSLINVMHGLRLETRMAYGVWCSVWFEILSYDLLSSFFDLDHLGFQACNKIIEP